MATPWFRQRVWLSRIRETLVIADRTGRSPEEVAGFLGNLWSFATMESKDGTIPGLTLCALVRAIGGDTALWEAVVQVGWLRIDTDGITFPNWSYWLSDSAKERANAAARQGKRRKVRVSNESRSSHKKVTAKSRKSHVPTVTQKENKKETLEVPFDTRIDTDSQPDPFEAFWLEWPRKENKKKARDAWVKLKPSPELISLMRQAVARQKLTDGWVRGYIPHLSTWINNRRWEDEQDCAGPLPAVGRPNPRGNPSALASDEMRNGNHSPPDEETRQAIERTRERLARERGEEPQIPPPSQPDLFAREGEGNGIPF